MKGLSLALVALVVFPALASAGGVVAAKPSEVLTVFSGGSTADCPSPDVQFVSQVQGDGNQTAFSIPTGQVFVVTEAEIAVNPGILAANRADALVPFRPSTGTSPAGAIPFVTDSTGAAFARAQITPTPIKGVICQGFSGTLGYAVLHGFLTKDR
jgi:hypothetical protein